MNALLVLLQVSVERPRLFKLGEPRSKNYLKKGNNTAGI